MDIRVLRPAYRRLILGVAFVAVLALVVAAGRFSPDGGERPGLAGFIGRFHPLLLHAPVTLLPLALAMEFFTLRWRPQWREATGFVMTLAVLSTLVATAAGLMLGHSGGFSGIAVDRHLYGGVLTSALAVGAWILLAREAGVLRKIGVVLLIAAQGALVWTAHIGGGLTHGDDYLAAGLPPEWRDRLGFVPVKNVGAEAGVPVDPAFEHDVKPLLIAACVDCHKEGKVKGGLRLDSLAGLVRGGTSGAAVVPGKPDASELFRRLRLPPSDEKAMPPAPRKRLDPAQVEQIRKWILGVKAPFGDAAKTATTEAPKDEDGVHNYYGDAPVPPPGDVPDYHALASKAEAYTAKTGAVLIPVSARPGDGLLLRTQAARTTFDDAALAGIADLAPLVVEADFSHTKVGDAGLAKSLSGFGRVRRLDLSGLAVSAGAARAVAAMPSLGELLLVGCRIDDASFTALGASKSLRKIYVSGTKVTPAAIAALKKQAPQCEVAGDAPVLKAPDAADPRLKKK